MFDLEKEYGIVLEGGGAKGSYQIGVWKALHENGVKIKGVVGTSVGSLNGALIAQQDIEKALEIWENITYSMVMDVDDESFKNVQSFNLKELDFRTIMDKFIEVTMNRGFDITPLRHLIAETVDERLVRAAGIDFGLVTVSITDRKPLELFLEDIPEGELQDYLLASSYLPVFKSEKLMGKTYLDGGFFDKAPIKLLVDKGYEDIIVIKVNGIGMSRRVDLKGINVYEISPTEDLGGIIEFDKEKSRYNIKLGYYDTLRFIQGLKGDRYYIHCNKSEAYFINRFLRISNTLKKKLNNYIFNEDIALNRYYLFDGLSSVAKELKLSKEWTYIDLGIAIIEYVCNVLEVERFKVYEFKEIVDILLSRKEEYLEIISHDKTSKEIQHIAYHFIKNFK